MPKLKTHKGMKKRFKISATGKVSHKRCGSSHLMSHKSGKRVRRLRKSTTLKVAAEAHRIRNAMLEKQNVNPVHVATLKHEAMAEQGRRGPRGRGARRSEPRPKQSDIAVTAPFVLASLHSESNCRTCRWGRCAGACSFLIPPCRFSTVESETVNAF